VPAIPRPIDAGDLALPGEHRHRVLPGGALEHLRGGPLVPAAPVDVMSGEEELHRCTPARNAR